MGVVSNLVGRGEIEAGDHIYSWRKGYVYAHHGIYIGDGLVIHFTRAGAQQEIGTGTFLDRLFASSMPPRGDIPCEKCGDQSSLEGVIISCLDCFLSGGDLNRFRYAVSRTFFLAKLRSGTCTLAGSDPPAEVLHRAECLLQHGGFESYDLFEKNCEDFAVYCKTGLLVPAGSSGQLGGIKSAARAVAGSSGLWGGINSAARSVSGSSGHWGGIKSAARAVAGAPLGLRFLSMGFGGATVVAGGLYCANRVASDIGVRGDAVKVPVEELQKILR